MTPLLQSMSVLITLALSTITVPLLTLMTRDSPFTVLTEFIFAIWDAKSFPAPRGRSGWPQGFPYSPASTDLRRSWGQLCERLVCGSKDRKRALPLESVNKTSGLECRNQCLE